MKKLFLVTTVLMLLAMAAAAWTETTLDEKFKINEIVQRHLPGLPVEFCESREGTGVVVGNVWEGIYYSFLIPAPDYNVIKDGWIRFGYEKKAGVIKEEISKHLNRSAQEMLRR